MLRSTLVLAILAAAPLLAQAPFGTAFTYQGDLNDVFLGPGDGGYDIRFTLFDAAAGGTQIGSVTENNLTVTRGIFTARLDFGPGAFDGGARWLELAVQAAGSGFTTLSPRQPITAVPFALTIYARTVVVKPLGTPAQNGSFLLSAISGISAPSASNRWTVKLEPGEYDVGTPGLLVMPSYVDLEGSGEDVTRIKSTGSALNTEGTIKAANASEVRFLTAENTGGGLAYAKAVYVSGTSGTLRHVTARASGAATENQGIYVDGAASPTVTDATIFVDSGATAANGFGFLNVGATTAVMLDIESFVTGGGAAEAFFNFGAAPDMRHVHGIAANASTTSYGLNNLNGTSVTIRDSSFIASGPGSAFGVQNVSSGVTLENVRAVGTTTTAGGVGIGIVNVSTSLSTFDSSAQGSGSGTTYGLNATTSSISATRSLFVATGTPGYGLVDNSSTGGPYTVKVDGSTLQGATNSLSTSGTATTAVFVGGSHFNGPTSVALPSTHTCAGTWNAAYAFFASTCPP